MDRKIFLHVQGGRSVSGVLRGFDIFLNLVLDQATEELGGGQKRPCGMIVSFSPSSRRLQTRRGRLRRNQIEKDRKSEERKMNLKEGS